MKVWSGNIIAIALLLLSHSSLGFELQFRLRTLGEVSVNGQNKNASDFEIMLDSILREFGSEAASSTTVVIPAPVTIGEVLNFLAVLRKHRYNGVKLFVEDTSTKEVVLIPLTITIDEPRRQHSLPMPMQK